MFANFVKRKITVFLISQLFIVCWLNSSTYAEDITNKKRKGIIAQKIEELSLNIQKDFKPRLKEKQKLRVAVVELENVGNIAKSQDMGNIISEMLTAKLSQNENIELVERDQLDKVIKELELSQSDMTDPKSANKVGKILAANAILCGSVSEMGQFFIINIRLVDVEEARIIAASSTEIKIRKSDFLVEVESWMTDIKSITQQNLVAIAGAINSYVITNIQKYNKVIQPKSLEELVPKYLERIPNPGKGSWKYNWKTGKLYNTAYPDMVLTADFQKTEKIMNDVKNIKIVNGLRILRSRIGAYCFAHGGKYPDKLTDLVPRDLRKLPDPLDGEWEYNSETGEVSHSSKVNIWYESPILKEHLGH